MIKTIVKRDGRIEDFSPSKVNNWGLWAAKTLGSYVDWTSVVLETVSTLPEVCTSEMLQERLIKTCLDNDSWSYNRMAGRLYAALLNKKFYNDVTPTVKDLHTRIQATGLMEKLDYSDDEYAEIEKIINHKLDLKATHYELHHIREKYAIKNRHTGEEFETQQFTYMRMAMALAEDQPRHRRMTDLRKWYEHFSQKRINAPTPNYVNLGTKLRGYASCCVYTTHDNAMSLAIGDHIAYVMTCMSAGIGSHINTRSIGDPVRGGAIKHQGRLPYYRALVGAVKANLQNGRGGAATTYYPCFDPEVDTIARLKNPMTPDDKKIRGMDYSFGSNKFFARKAAKNELVFLFNSWSAPDLYAAFYSADIELFEELYNKYEADPLFPKNYVDAREVLLTVLNEEYETGRSYEHFLDEMNRHTPFKDTIWSSNLCTEIFIPSAGYFDMRDLYSEEDHGRGEIGLCSLGGAVVSNIESDEQYEEVMYYTLLMIDKCIHMSDYALPHLGVTAKARLSAGVGILGLAHYLAKRKLSYSSQEGKNAIHEVAESHMYFAIKASLRLAKELGNAPWMHKTKWPKGWMPIDTYNKNVDGVVTVGNKRDWEALRAGIIAQGGIRNSVLVAHMPTESSSKASGTTNGVYPVRDLTLLKGDNTSMTYWAAPEGEKLAKFYELAWDISAKDITDSYAIIQKFTDQGISADYYRRVIGDDTVTSSEMLRDYFYRVKMGLKSKYYTNTKTTNGTELNSELGEVCESCTL